RNKYHTLPEKLKPVPAAVEFNMPDIAKPAVYWTNYDMVQEEIMFLSKGPEFDKTRIPISRMFNEYFGGNMSSPVFQELREAQGLAYSAYGYYGTADKAKGNDQFFAYIGTQADKQTEAMNAMNELLVNFPKSTGGLEIARNAILNQIESERITKTDILFNYETARKRGLNYDVRKEIYEETKKFSMDDLVKFQQQYIKGNRYNIVLIGSRDKINFSTLKPYGQVQELTLDQIFGYEKVQKIDTEAPN
ncbi:MAG TPA: insulinase family protein, partial [Chryseolinea sp.]|nr:insulinase family protein [Chryseolinea sp.]